MRERERERGSQRWRNGENAEVRKQRKKEPLGTENEKGKKDR